MEKEYYDAQVNYMNEIRSIKHDIQAHMIVLQYYLESENYDKAKRYLNDMRVHQDFENMTFFDTGNDLVNAIVNDTLSRSSKSIKFSYTGMFPERLKMEEYDVCTLFSNVFANAKEACEKLEHTTPTIHMEIQSDKEFCKVVVQNPIEWKIDTAELGKSTSKKNKSEHGYGIKNMIRVVKQYGGKIDFLVTDTTFRVEILF